MPVIAYQSFNSNASKTHGLQSAAFQNFTKSTNKYVTGQQQQALVLPINTDNLTDPIQGPAHLMDIEPLTSKQTLCVFGGQIASVWQNLYRALAAMPDIMVVGELDASHSDFQQIVTDSKLQVHSHPSTKACQSFSAFAQASVASQIHFLGTDTGWVAYSVGGLNCVFVHVPNAIATKQGEVQKFYKDISNTIGTIHLVIGDTNQSSVGFTAGALNDAFGLDSVYCNATETVEKIDNWNVVEKGTNSNASKMYDIAVYRSDVVKVLGGAYISQSSQAVTVTDHCGLGVSIALK